MLYVNFAWLLDLSLRRGMDKYLLEIYAAMEIRHIQETYSIPQYTLTWLSYLLGVLHKHDSSRNISVNSILNLQWPH